jgi:rhombotail lipoprotein
MKRKITLIVAILTMLALVTGCASMWMGNQSRKGASSSLVDYLYPNGEIPPDFDATIPNLNLPLRVGLAFVPAVSNTVEGLSEAHKTRLLEKVRASFAGKEFIKSIQVVPDTYMRSARGFETVDQVARLYGLDVMALVSYDQIAHMDETKASIFYWTLIGAYFVKGNRNDVQTFVDTAVFDVKTHKLLFRAPGTDKINATTTLVNSKENMRKAREASFDLAMEDMTQNLDKELAGFTERIKQDKSVEISHREGYTGGGGAFGPIPILILLGLAIGHRRYGARKKV